MTETLLTLFGFGKRQPNALALLVDEKEKQIAALRFDLKVESNRHEKSFVGQRPSENINIQRLAKRIGAAETELSQLKKHQYSLQARRDRIASVKTQHNVVDIIAAESRAMEPDVVKLTKKTKKNQEEIRKINERSGKTDNLLSMSDDMLDDIDADDATDNTEPGKGILDELDHQYVDSILSHAPRVKGVQASVTPQIDLDEKEPLPTNKK